MSLLPSLVEMIQKISKRAVEESQPVAIVYGTVTGTDPLKINIEQKLTLEIAHLVLTNNVQDYMVEMSIEGGIKRNYTVHNKLQEGDTVILLRQQGGQKYIVLDKAVT